MSLFKSLYELSHAPGARSSSVASRTTLNHSLPPNYVSSSAASILDVKNEEQPSGSNDSDERLQQPAMWHLPPARCPPRPPPPPGTSSSISSRHSERSQSLNSFPDSLRVSATKYTNGAHPHDDDGDVVMDSVSATTASVGPLDSDGMYSPADIGGGLDYESLDGGASHQRQNGRGIAAPMV